MDPAIKQRSYKRRFYFINRPLQVRYMVYTVGTLLIVTGAALANLYFGIWASITQEFSSERVRDALLNTAHVHEYEVARRLETENRISALSLFKETDLLSARQREVLSDILARTNQKLVVQILILFALLGVGTVFLSHKIAGPLYRFDQSFKAVAQGNMSLRVHLRKGDEALELTQSFNAMMETLEGSVRRLKDLARNISSRDSQAALQQELARFQTR